MNYNEFVNHIMNLRRFGKQPGIEVSRQMLKALGNPESNMKIIHVAGTNGKGSCCAYMASGLAELSCKVGVFTSPHLVDFNERIQVNSQVPANHGIVQQSPNPTDVQQLWSAKQTIADGFVPISHEDVLRLGNVILDLNIDAELTMFDVTLGIAILYFQEVGCDYVILETGLGGTYDSTTAISVIPRVCVVTSIGLDHTAILGDTYAKVAENKAGIIVPGTSVVLSKMPEEARQVMLARCEELEIKDVVDLNQIDLGDNQVGSNGTDDTQSIEKIQQNDNSYPILSNQETGTLQLLSGYQQINASAANAALRLLISQEREEFIARYMDMQQAGDEHCGADCSKCADENGMCGKFISFDEWIDMMINKALVNTKWPGRLEHIANNIIIDGAHNPEGFTAFRDYVAQRYNGVNVHLILGVLADKDYTTELEIIKPVITDVLTATIDDERAKDGDELAVELLTNGFRASSIGGEAEVAHFLLEIMQNNNANSTDEIYNDVYVLCGSLYFVGNVKRLLWQLQQE